MTQTAGLQERIYCAILEFWKTNGYSPSNREIADATGVASTNTINYHLERLQEAGALTKVPGQPRTIVLTGYQWSMDEALGVVSNMCEFDGESL